MNRETYDLLVQEVRRGDSLHHQAAGRYDKDGDMHAVIAGALLALDQRISCFLFAFMEHEWERLEEDEAEERASNETD